jgi:hypothetical protein
VLQFIYSRATGEEPIAPPTDTPRPEALGEPRPVAGEPRMPNR